jgi:poly-gamma-glutamate synthesis protein (capsule biosynthesis protein)
MDEDVLRLAFVGDVCLSFYDGARAGVSESRNWSDIKGAIGEHDFLVGNLECCLVDEHCSEKALAQPMAVPAAAAGPFLRNIGFSDLCLANNHSLDCGSDAVAVTRECLASHGMRGFGAGLNLHEAEAPVFAEHHGRKVAFLGACDRSEYYASDGRAGIAPLQKSRLEARVRTAAARADLVVVMLHADLEFSDVPGLWRQRLSRWLIDQGAHMVIQHHPHVLQGIETYQGGVIAYSLGNFIFKLHGNRYQQHQAGVFDSLVLIVDVDLRGEKPALAHRVVPLRIGHDHLPEPVTGPTRDEALRRVQVLSSLVADRTAHRSVWFRRCRWEAVRRIRYIFYAFRRGHIARGIRGLRQLLICREDHRWMLGLATLGYL